MRGVSDNWNPYCDCGLMFFVQRSALNLFFPCLSCLISCRVGPHVAMLSETMGSVWGFRRRAIGTVTVSSANRRPLWPLPEGGAPEGG